MKRYVTGKLGNMRKEVEWIIYPQKDGKPEEVLIQSDRRIAMVWLTKGAAVLSSGKAGHPGTIELSAHRGATLVTVPVAMRLAILERIASGVVGVGAVVVTGL